MHSLSKRLCIRARGILAVLAHEVNQCRAPDRGRVRRRARGRGLDDARQVEAL